VRAGPPSGRLPQRVADAVGVACRVHRAGVRQDARAALRARGGERAGCRRHRSLSRCCGDVGLELEERHSRLCAVDAGSAVAGTAQVPRDDVEAVQQVLAEQLFDVIDDVATMAAGHVGDHQHRSDPVVRIVGEVPRHGQRRRALRRVAGIDGHSQCPGL
jgi:hypothetical protein